MQMRDAAGQRRRCSTPAVSVVEGLRRLIGTGKVFDMSMGLIIAGCFSSLVRSLADNIVAPVVSFLLPIERALKNMFHILQCGPGSNVCSYDSVELASKAGAVTLNWGAFIQSWISAFVLVLAVYIVVNVYNSTFVELRYEERSCPYCITKISSAASRCPNCTSEIKPILGDPSKKLS